MEENNKMCSEGIEIKENDCKLTDEELEAVTGGVNHDVEPDEEPDVLPTVSQLVSQVVSQVVSPVAPQDEGDFISPTIHLL